MRDVWKGRKVLEWVGSVLVGLSFVASGAPKIVPSGSMISRFEAWGYSAEFATVVGVAELAGGLAILWPRTRRWGAGTLGVIMVGAVGTHVRSGIGSPVTALVYLALIGLVWWASRPSGLQEVGPTGDA